MNIMTDINTKNIEKEDQNLEFEDRIMTIIIQMLRTMIDINKTKTIDITIAIKETNHTMMLIQDQRYTSESSVPYSHFQYGLKSGQKRKIQETKCSTPLSSRDTFELLSSL